MVCFVGKVFHFLRKWKIGHFKELDTPYVFKMNKKFIIIKVYHEFILFYILSIQSNRPKN